MSNDAFELNTKTLDGVLKALKENMSRVRVGILGGKVTRSSSKANNATIGAVHEFGNATHPQRSFLRVPISEHLGKELESHGAFTEDALKRVVREKSLKPWLERIGDVALKIVSDAFDTGGFGKWPKWKHPEERAKNSNAGMLLVDTTQLRNSITREVK